MFNAATGRIKLNWKVLAGLAGAVLIVMLIGYLGPEEPKVLAAGPASSTAGPVRPVTPDARNMEQLKAAARASVGQGSTSPNPPAMVEEPARASQQVVAAPTTRPSAVVAVPTNNPTPAPAPVRPMPAPAPVTAVPTPPPSVTVVAPSPATAQPQAPAATSTVTAVPTPAAAVATPTVTARATPRPAPNQDPGDVSRTAAAGPTPVPAQPVPPQPAPVAAATDDAPAAPETPAEAEPESGMLAADVASQPVEGSDDSDQKNYLAKMYNFNLKGAEWKDVLDYFSRHTRLTILGDTQDLTGTVDFYHAQPMTFRQAFRFLNRLLASQPQQRIALLRKDHIQIIKVTGSTAWLRYLELDRMYDSYDGFVSAELPEDEKCVVFYTPQQADGPSLVDMYRQFAPDYMLIQAVGDSNELMVAGQAADVDRWLKLVQRPIVEDLRQTRKFVLKNAQATDVRNMLTTMFPTQGSTGPRPMPQSGQPGTNVTAPRIASDKIDIWADDKNAALVVKATPRKLDEIAKLLDVIDVDTPDDMAMHVYKLQHARADDLANTFRQVFTAVSTPRPGGKPGAGWWRRSANSPAMPVQVFPDASTNSLLVLADKDAQQEVKNLVERFDVEDAAGQMVRIALKNSRAEQVVQILQQAFGPMMKPTSKGPPMTLSADTVNNAVIAVGDPQLLAKAQDTIAQLDVSNDQTFEHVVRLEHARPSEVANALSGIFQPKAGQPAMTRFLPIEAASTLVIVAPPTDWQRIEPMITKVDEQAQISSPQMKSFPLEHADAATVANILNQAAAGQAQRNPGAALTKAYGDPRTNAVFVQAMPDAFNEVEALIKQLDIADAQGGTVVVTLQNADANLAAATLQPMASKPSTPGGQPIQIAAEAITNSVIIRNANKADMAQIKEMLANMDVTVGTTISHTFRPKFIDAADLANIINTQYVNLPGKAPGVTSVKAVAGPGTVVVDAPADVMEKIIKKVADLDVPSPFGGSPLVIDVKSADPKELVNILNVMYSRGPKGPIAQFTASAQSLLVQAPEAAREDILKTVKSLDVPGNNMEPRTYKLANADASQIEPLVRNILNASNRPGNPPAQVSSDTRTNSLVVAAQPQQHALVEQTLSQLDDKPASDVENVTQVIPLANSQAADTTRILQESLASAAGKSGGMTRVRFSASQSGNAVVLTGPKMDVAKAAAMVKEIEKSATEFGSVTRTYTLTSASAVDAAKVLEKFAAAAPGKEGLKISADERSNTLFVSGPAARFEDVEKAIKTLDAEDVSPLSDVAIDTVNVTRGDPWDIAYKAQKVLDIQFGKAAPTVDSDIGSPTVTIMGKKEAVKKAREVIEGLVQSAPPEKERIAVRKTKVPADVLMKALNEYASEYVTGKVRVEQAGGTRGNLKPEDYRVKELLPQTRQQESLPTPVRGIPNTAAPATRPTSSDNNKRGPGAPLGLAPVIGMLQSMALGQTAAAPAMQTSAAEPAESEVVIKIDPETGQLAIVGNSTQIDQIDELLKMIEDAYKNEDEAFVIKVYQLQYLNASSASQTLEQMFNDAPVAVPQPPQPQPGQPGQPGQPQQPQQPQQPGQPAQPVNQQRGNDTGGRRGQSRGQQQQQQIAGGRQRIRAIADLRVNAVIVRCSPQDITRVTQFLATIDREPEITQEMRILQIKNMKASDIERIIKDVMRISTGKTGSGAAPAAPPAVPGQPAVTELRQQLIALNFGGKEGTDAKASYNSTDTITITSEDTSNTLYVSGPKEFLNLIEKFVAEVDSAATQMPRIFTLARFNAVDMAKILQTVFQQSGGGQGAKGSGPIIVPDDRTNTLLVSASTSDMAKIESVVTQYEGAGPRKVVSKVIPLTRTDPKEIQQLIDQIQGASKSGGSGASRVSYQPTQATPPSDPQGAPQPQRQFRGQGSRRGGGGGGSGAGGSTGGDGQPSGDAGEKASDPLSELKGADTFKASTAMSGGRSFWAIPGILSSLMLGQVAPAQQMDQDQAGATQPAQDQADEQPAPPGEAAQGGTAPAVAPPGQEAPAVGQPAPAEPPVGEAIPQGPADQQNEPVTRRLLPRVIRPAQSQPAVETAPAVPLPVLSPEQIEQIRTGQIRITPVGPNEVIIEGPEESVAAMESLIRELEQGVPQPKIQVFPLKNAQATPLAQQLTTIFQQLQAGRTPRAEEKVTIVADARSNSLVVAAAPERMEEIKALIENLDAKPVIAEVEYRTYLLKHIQASEAASTLSDLLKRLQQQRGVQGDQFTVTPEDRTNTLIITAPKSDMQQIENLIGTLDVLPAFATAEMMVYPLHNVTAKDLVTVLNDMISTQISRAGAAAAGGAGKAGAGGGAETIRRLRLRTAEGQELPELDLERPIKILAEPNTNSVVVSSTPENLQSMNDVIKLLDTYPIAESVRVWVFPLQYADATELATMLTKTFQDGRSVGLRAPPTGGQVPVVPGVPPTPAGQALMFNAVIMADARTNTLMVAGRQQALDLADQLIAKLDKPSQLSKLPIHIVRLDNNDAATVAPLLEKLFTQQGGKAVADKVSIIPEPGTNALLISANPENFKTLQGLVADLDTFPDPQNLVRTFVLQNADATQVADTLKNLFSQPIYQVGGVPVKPGTEKASKISIQSDPRTNSIIISAKKENWPLIEQLIKQMDSPSGPPVAGNFTVIQMRNTDAGKMASTLTDLMDQINKARTAAGAKQTQALPVIISDPRTNSLLVAGAPAAIEQVQTLAARLDIPSNKPTAEIRVYSLKQASPDKIETVINDLFGRGGRGGGGGGGGAAATGAGAGAAGRAATQMQVYADNGSNSLIVSASPEDHVLVANLVKMLDVPDQAAAQVRLFPLDKATAQTVIQVLQSLYTMRSSTGTGTGQGQGFGATGGATGGGGGGARSGSATGVTFTADERTNSVIVRAAPGDMHGIEDLIHRLDTAEVPEAGIRWVQLKRADASDLAKMLSDFLQVQSSGGTSSSGGYSAYSSGFVGSSAGSSNQQRALVINFHKQNAQGEDVLQKLLRQDIRITPDTRTNSLFLMAPPDSVDVLVALIESLDSISPVTVEIEMFQLQNADATETVTTLERLFGLSTTTGTGGTTGSTGNRAGQTGQEQRNLMLAQQGLGGLPGGVAPGAALTPGAVPGLGGLGGAGLMGGLAGLEALGGMGPTSAGGRPILSFTVDTRTNSVIAAGAPDYLTLVRQLVEQLDSQEMATRVNRVYTVKYAPATQLATDLGNFFKEETTRLNELKQDIPTQRRIEQEVSVVNAKDTNKLLISVSPRYESQVMDLVRELDQQPPMVMIQVLMAEVTLDNNIEWGFEFASQDLHFTKTGSGSNVVAGTNLGAAGSGTGFTFSLTGEDFSLLMHTLQTESRVQVLSRPQLMVIDNQEANIQVGEQVPYVSNYTVLNNGQLQTVVSNQQVGIIVKVTPHITPDDYVRMEVAPEISALSPSTVQISENLSAPIITKRNVSTTVTVKNGETVVIGGLIRNSRSITDTKVPILGDIPILGYLFKSQNFTDSRDELLIVMTPRIMRTAEDAANISIEQRDVGGIIPYQTRRSPLWQGLQIITPKAPAVPGQTPEQTFPATQPTMYGPQPILYGPRPPSAKADDVAPQQQGSIAPTVSESPSQVEPVSYLEQRR